MKHYKRLLFLLSVCLTCQLIEAQTSVIRGRNMKTEEQPVRISEVQIDVQLLGPLAKTTVSLSVFNPNDRILEGEFNFPLADGQSISRFALDVDGKMREGVAVDKAKAQKFFESIVRQQVDPGLIEKTQGNNFRTRVYPIPAQGMRKIIIAYEQELPRNGENYTYILPFNYGEKFDLFVNIEASGYSQKPKITQSPSHKLKFKEESNLFVVQYSGKKQKKAQPLIISIPANQTKNILTETNPETNEKTFYSRVFPTLSSNEKILPEKICLYWDASLSMENKDIDKEMELLDKYFKQINNAQVELYTFNISLGKKSTYQVTNGNWSELKKALLAVRYDGATYVGDLNFANTNADAILLFSDGINNFGKGNISYKNTPVFAITSLAKADYNTLKYMSVVSGGKYIDLTTQSADQAVNAMVEQNFRLISAECNASEVSDLAFLQYIPNVENGFSITGKLIAPKTKIKLNFGIGSEVLTSEVVEISDLEAMPVNDIIKRLQAEKQIADLEIAYEVNKKEIEALGRAYNIVTQNTSLIVLENIGDYVEFRITPPEELLDDYNARVARLDSRQKDIEGAKEELRLQEIENTVNLLERKREWWKKEFPKTPPPKPKHSKIVEATVEGMSEGGVDIADLQEHRIIVQESREALFSMEERPVENFVPEAEEKKNDRPKEVKNPTIKLEVWNPDMPYMEALNAASNDQLYEVYLSTRNDYKEMPSFYIDASILMQNRGLPNEALLVISNLAEIKLEDHRLLRVLAHRLLHTRHTKQAIYQFEVVKRLRPEEPQTFRDLALAYDQHKEYQKAIDCFIELIETPFDRFGDIKLYAVEEINNTIEHAKRDNINLDISRVDARLIENMPVDIRVMMSWDSDNTDIDLWVEDPHNQQCFYGSRETYNGGMYFSDFTGGYGPETYQIREAIKGKYIIVAKYYANHSESLTGPTSIYLDIFTQYATDKEQKETIIVRLDKAKEELTIGEIKF